MNTEDYEVHLFSCTFKCLISQLHGNNSLHLGIQTGKEDQFKLDVRIRMKQRAKLLSNWFPSLPLSSQSYSCRSLLLTDFSVLLTVHCSSRVKCSIILSSYSDVDFYFTLIFSQGQCFPVLTFDCLKKSFYESFYFKMT